MLINPTLAIPRQMQYNLTPDIKPPFVCRSLWRYVEYSGTSKCGKVWNFCLLTFLCAKQGWRYIGGWLHVLLCGLPIFLARSQNCEKRLLIMSVRMNSAPTRRNFMKSDIWVLFENQSRKFKFHKNLTGIADTLHEDLCTFVTISRSVMLRMINASDKSCRENQNTHFMFNNLPPKIVPFMR